MNFVTDAVLVVVTVTGSCVFVTTVVVVTVTVLIVLGGIWLQQTSDSREASYAQDIEYVVVSEFVSGACVVSGRAVGFEDRCADGVGFGRVIVMIVRMVAVLMTVSSTSVAPGFPIPEFAGQEVYSSPSLKV